MKTVSFSGCRTFIVIALGLIPATSFATDPLPAGEIRDLSYRGGYVNFRVVDSGGTNHCAPCPGDPGLMGSGACWIAETDAAQVSMLLLAYSNGQQISGRLLDLATNCAVYQMTLVDQG